MTTVEDEIAAEVARDNVHIPGYREEWTNRTGWGRTENTRRPNATLPNATHSVPPVAAVEANWQHMGGLAVGAMAIDGIIAQFTEEERTDPIVMGLVGALVYAANVGHYINMAALIPLVAMARQHSVVTGMDFGKSLWSALSPDDVGVDDKRRRRKTPRYRT